MKAHHHQQLWDRSSPAGHKHISNDGWPPSLSSKQCLSQHWHGFENSSSVAKTISCVMPPQRWVWYMIATHVIRPQLLTSAAAAVCAADCIRQPSPWPTNPAHAPAVFTCSCQLHHRLCYCQASCSHAPRLLLAALLWHHPHCHQALPFCCRDGMLSIRGEAQRTHWQLRGTKSQQAPQGGLSYVRDAQKALVCEQDSASQPCN